MKSLILRMGLKYSKIHDIGELFEVLSRKIDIPSDFIVLKGFTKYASAERYESPLSHVRLDCHHWLEIVRLFLEWIQITGS